MFCPTCGADLKDVERVPLPEDAFELRCPTCAHTLTVTTTDNQTGECSITVTPRTDGGSQDCNCCIEYQCWLGGEGEHRQPTLVVTANALVEILNCDSTVLDPDVDPGLMAAIAGRASKHEASDRDAIADWCKAAGADEASDDEDDDEE